MFSGVNHWALLEHSDTHTDAVNSCEKASDLYVFGILMGDAPKASCLKDFGYLYFISLAVSLSILIAEILTFMAVFSPIPGMPLASLYPLIRRGWLRNARIAVKGLSL